MALQTWLRSEEFTYSLDAPDDNGSAAIIEFLDQRRGYCIHFASTMAVMARVLGIPARVAVGFTAGRSLGDGKYAVGTDDAHSWPELYFPTVGWLAFEPTPSIRTGQPPAYARVEADSPGTPVPGEPRTQPSAAPVITPDDQARLTWAEVRETMRDLRRAGRGRRHPGAPPNG